MNDVNSRESRSERHRLLRRRARAIPLRFKLLISFVSLFLFLVFAELGLRFAGYLYVYNHIYDAIPLGGPYDDGRGEERAPPGTPERPTRTILCVGDSFTVGSKVEKTQTYPVLLQSRLAALWPNVDVRVYNKGICEATTGVVKNHLASWIREYRPDAIILLVGSANRFNPIDYELWADANAWTVMKSSFSHLRIFKVLRAIRLNESRHRVLQTVYPGYMRHEACIYHQELDRALASDDAVRRYWSEFRAGNLGAAIASAESASREGSSESGRIEALYALTRVRIENGDLEEAVELLDGPLAALPASDENTNCRAYYYALMCGGYFSTRHYDPDRMIDYCLAATDLDPFNSMYFYGVAKAFDVQSRYDARAIHQHWVRLGETYPDLREFGWYRDYLRLFADKTAWDAGVGEWIRRDLDEIVAECRASGVRTLLPNYPVDYAVANSAIADLAATQSLPLVDLRSRFAALEPRSDFLFDDDHTTARGNEEMVKLIVEALARIDWTNIPGTQ
ncbi:MAG: hypothetical protein IT350_15235 [Deltaproteobacteria bacterium]|nr:hypothetical protein [Deltaproteobacteria bacterium]